MTAQRYKDREGPRRHSKGVMSGQICVLVCHVASEYCEFILLLEHLKGKWSWIMEPG